MPIRRGEVSQPIYYKGYIIQILPDGYWVYEPKDTSRPIGEWFPTVVEAFRYIDEKKGKGE